MTEIRRNSSIRRAMNAGQGRVVLALAAVAALFASVGVFHTSARVAVVRAGYELGRVEAEYRKLVRENAHLKMERATLRSAPRLEAIARSRLGMVPPPPGRVMAIQHQAAQAASPARAQAGKVAVAALEQKR